MPTKKEIEAVQLIQSIIEDPKMRRHLKRHYQKSIGEGAHPHTGFCTMASDALRRILGGQVRGFSGYKLCRVVHEGGPHYYLTTPSGEVLDPTAAQFKTRPPYERGKGKALSTPSRIPGTDVQSPTQGARAIMEYGRRSASSDRYPLYRGQRGRRSEMNRTDRSALIRLASSMPVGNADRKTILTGLASSPLRTRQAGRVPSNAPKQVKQVAKAWVQSAIKAGEEVIAEEGETGAEAKGTRGFWKDRLYVYVEDSDKGPRWVVGDNYDRATNMIYYPDSDEWYSMPSYGSERLMRGGFQNALGSAEIIWTG